MPAEVVMVVVSALLGAVFQSAIPKLNYHPFLALCRTAGVHSKAKNVMKHLQSLQKVLDVAEHRQFEDVAVKDWVDDLRDVALDLEVILDEFDTYQLQKQLGIDTGAVHSKLKFRWEFRSQVKDIASRLQHIRDRMDLLDLKPVSGMSGASSAAIMSEDQRMQRETTSALTDSGLFVRDAEKQKLIDLVKNAAVLKSNSRLHVLAVVGLGGMGKTTLAQRVYNDDQVTQSFDMKAWVCISDQFKLMTIMENILREIGGGSSGSNSLQEVQKKIEAEIAGKTLLLFLDDAWERKHTEWERMWPLLHAAKQIIVVLTTRDEQVASSSGALRNEFVLLDKLSDEDCLSIFQRYAFQNRDIAAHPVLKDIGVQIVKKCDGSPLAAKVLGGILQSKSTEHEWKRVLHSRLLAGEENPIRSILILSYHHLHMSLKRCFAFIAIFPKDYEFEEQEIVLLWMAQGFLQHTNQTELEDVGHNYFYDLLSRSLFQPSPSKTGSYVMHDLIHNLAQEVAGKTCFRLEEMMRVDQIHKCSSTTRYVSYAARKLAVEKFRPFGEARSLQTFVHIENEYEDGYECTKVNTYLAIDDILCKLCHVQVLSLRGCISIYELPHSITKLKHLRYLDLSHTRIIVLQDSICTLVNLQTLLLKHCGYLVKLPDDLSNLINIRHLDISGSTRITEMPLGFNNLKSLCTLSDFVVGKDVRRGIQQLKDLNQIKGSLCMSELQNVTILGYARQAMLKEKLGLRTLTMRWRNSNDDSNHFEKIIEDVLEELQAPKKLEELTIENFMGTKLPRWMGDSSFSNITSLDLRFCEKCTCLPSLGRLPALTHLHIKAFKAIVRVDSYFYGEPFPESFSSLKTLKFEDMPEWEDWFVSDDVKVFPRLEGLSICGCPKLSRKLPEQLPELKVLMLKDCKLLEVSLPRTSKLYGLRIDGCKEVSCNDFNGWSSLKYLTMKNIEALNIPEEVTTLGLRELETDCVKLATTVTSMSVLKNSESREKMCCRLEKLRLKGCSLEKLPQVLFAKDSSFRLEVTGCPNLISFPDEIDFSNNNNNNNNNNSGDYSNSTVFIKVEDCGALENIPVFKMQEDYCFTSLVEMVIIGCHSLTGFGRGLLPRTLRRLELRDCNKLRCLLVVEEEEENQSNNNNIRRCKLDYLSIFNCESLEYLASSTATRGELPFRVKRLDIKYCTNIKSLIVTPLSSSSSSPLLEELPEELESLNISMCPELKQVAESFHINNNSSNALQSIRIYRCESLKCLPKGLHNMKSLKEFQVNCCEILEAPSGGVVNVVVDNNPALQLLNTRGWPAGNASLLNDGFQRMNTTLTTLKITYPNTCGRRRSANNNNKPISEWGLSRLVSLQELVLYGQEKEQDSDVVYFPKSISSELHSSSLIYLYIMGFRNLQYLSCHVFENLGSLKKLVIWYCPKLESFPKGGLPLSLLELSIHGCPKLLERYGKNKKKMKAKDWSKISHIPNIQINFKVSQSLSNPIF